MNRQAHVAGLHEQAFRLQVGEGEARSCGLPCWQQSARLPAADVRQVVVEPVGVVFGDHQQFFELGAHPA